MSTDLAALGFSVDSSQIDAAGKSLDKMTASSKSAQISADVLVAASVRLGISVQEVERRLAAANDDLANSTTLNMKLADATKQAAAANDNLANSTKNVSAATNEAGRGFFGTIEHVLNLTSHLKLLAVAAYALVPSFRGFVNSGLKTVLMEIIPVAGIMTTAIRTLMVALAPLLSFFASIGAPILIAVAAFELIAAVWNKGAALLDKYANSLRALYSEDTVQNLQKLTKAQGEAGEVISAEQIARATELGTRLQDASFTINKFLTTSVIDLTSASLKLQTVWVNIVELFAAGAQKLASIDWGRIGRAVAPVAAAAGLSNPITAVPTAAAIGASYLLSGSDKEDNTKSLQAAKDRLSAVMGVANLAKESLEKTKGAAADLDHEFDIGSSFIARYSDNIQKLANGVRDTDAWDRVAKSIERHTRAVEANAASLDKDISFQERLRVETQLLGSTKGGLSAATDDQIDKFVELRVKGVEPLNALMEAGIKLDKDRAKSFEEMGKAAGDARLELAKANAELSQSKALAADQISLKALTAFSPAQKGEIAALQKQLELRDQVRKEGLTQEQADERAAGARKLAYQTEIVQLQEVARARMLSGKQAVDSAKLENDLLNKDIGQQTELRANLQARQQLEQEASQKRTKFDDEQYERLKKINEELGKQTKINALNAANADITRGRQTSLLSPEDVQIAEQLKNIYPDVATALNSVQAAGLQTNRALSSLSSTISTNLVSGLADIFDGTKSVKDGFASMGKVIIRAIEEMVIKLLIVIPLMRALQSLVSATGFGFGGGSSEANAVASGIAPVMHSGGIVGQEPTAMRSVNNNIFRFAPRFHNGLMPDEFPAILQKGEGVFTKGQMAGMGRGGSPVMMNDNRTIIIGEGADKKTVEELKRALAEDRANRATEVINIVKLARSGRHLK